MKACVICFDFKIENIQRQPWVYIFQLCEYLFKNSIEIILITNTISNPIKDIKIKSVKRIYSFFWLSRDVTQIIERENPDIIFILLGISSFFRFRLKTKKPIIGVLTSPLYTFKELKKIGLYEFLYHFNYTYPHILTSITPDFILQRQSENFNSFIVLSEENRNRMEKIRIKKQILTIPPQIDKIFFDPPIEEAIKNLKFSINPKNIPLITYFTSPLTLRGTDTLVEAIVKVTQDHPVKLLLLSRIDKSTLKREEERILKIAEKHGICESVEIISRNLQLIEIKNYLAISDIICLPFKLVISDVPVSILEAMAVGKAVVSTNIDGIPSILQNKDVIIEPNNSDLLADTIVKLLRDPHKMREIGNKNKKLINEYYNKSDYFDKILDIIINQEILTS